MPRASAAARNVVAAPGQPRLQPPEHLSLRSLRSGDRSPNRCRSRGFSLSMRHCSKLTVGTSGALAEWRPSYRVSCAAPSRARRMAKWSRVLPGYSALIPSACRRSPFGFASLCFPRYRHNNGSACEPLTSLVPNHGKTGVANPPHRTPEVSDGEWSLVAQVRACRSGAFGGNCGRDH